MECGLQNGTLAVFVTTQLFDNITLSNPYRFIVIQNHIANKKNESDFIFYYDGEYPVKQHKMFGDRYDWEAEEKNINIF